MSASVSNTGSMTPAQTRSLREATEAMRALAEGRIDDAMDHFRRGHEVLAQEQHDSRLRGVPVDVAPNQAAARTIVTSGVVLFEHPLTVPSPGVDDDPIARCRHRDCARFRDGSRWACRAWAQNACAVDLGSDQPAGSTSWLP